MPAKKPPSAKKALGLKRAAPQKATEAAKPNKVTGNGTPEKPWHLQTPTLSGDLEVHRDPKADPPALVCRVGKTETPLSPALRGGSARDAPRARRLDAARLRG
jgi:hypothetical protein